MKQSKSYNKNHSKKRKKGNELTCLATCGYGVWEWELRGLWFLLFCIFWLPAQCWHVPNAILTGFARTHLHKVTEKRRQQQQQQKQKQQQQKKSTPVTGRYPPHPHRQACCVRGWHNLRLKGLNLSCRLPLMSALIFHLRWLSDTDADAGADSGSDPTRPNPKLGSAAVLTLHQYAFAGAANFRFSQPTDQVLRADLCRPGCNKQVALTHSHPRPLPLSVCVCV